MGPGFKVLLPRWVQFTKKWRRKLPVTRLPGSGPWHTQRHVHLLKGMVKVAVLLRCTKVLQEIDLTNIANAVMIFWFCMRACACTRSCLREVDYVDMCVATLACAEVASITANECILEVDK